MIFNEFRFLFLFLPIVAVIFFLPIFRCWRISLLLISSLYFYSLSGLEHLATLMFGVIWVYLLTRSTLIVGNRLLLVLAISGPSIALIYYKYSAFILNDLLKFNVNKHNEIFSLFENIILPVGISFFTFQMIAFAIDRYKGEIKEMPAINKLGLYISFFPQLVAGPILRYNNIAQYLNNLRNFSINKKDLTIALSFIIFGLASKVLLADNLGFYVSWFVKSPENLRIIDALYVVFGYSMQIYFDFYGYSMIAIGIGRLFGFQFPNNFLRPYETLNPRDFWRRWHITLSFWIRDYLYKPLGGNLRYIRNILIVFTICGLWHGAGWTFIIWGLYHAFLVLLYNKTHKWWDKIPSLIQFIMNFSLVSLGWVFFIFEPNKIYIFLCSLFGFSDGQAEWFTGIIFVEGLGILMVSICVCFFVNFERLILKNDWHPIVLRIYSVGLGALFVLSLLFVDGSNDFIYFRF